MLNNLISKLKNHTRSLYILVIFLFLLIRLTGLGNDISNSDGGRWHRRSEDFLTALKTGDLKSTYQHYQPGVTLMWVNAFVKQSAFSIQLLYTDEPRTLENADWFPIINGISVSVQVILLAGFLCLQMYVLSKLFGTRVALLYGFLISIEPYLFAIDRFFHLTSLETYSSFTAFLFMLLWTKSKSPVYLYVTGLLLAFSVLSKLTTLLTIPIYVITAFMVSRNSSDPIKNLVKTYGIIFLTFILCVYLGFPALWVDPFYVVGKFFSAIENAVTNDIRGESITGLFSYLYYVLILLYKLSPITLAIFAWSFWKSKSNFKDLSAYVLLYLALYYVGLTLSDQKIDRYVVTMLPPILLLCAIFIAKFSQSLQLKIILIVSVFTVWVLFTYKPVYSAYYNPQMGGLNSAVYYGLYDNSGEYFAQAAAYLNTLGRDKYTYIPHNLDSFQYYYKGKIQRSFEFGVTDYAVVSVDHPESIPVECSRLIQSFGPDISNEYVTFVYECKK